MSARRSPKRGVRRQARGRRRGPASPSKRARTTLGWLKKEPRRSASRRALSRQAREAALRRQLAGAD